MVGIAFFLAYIFGVVINLLILQRLINFRWDKKNLKLILVNVLVVLIAFLMGRFFINPGLDTSYSRTFDKNGNLIPFSSNGPAGDGVGATGFNRSDYRTIAIPTKRMLFSSKGEHAINDSHSVFFEGTFASSRTNTRVEPFPADIGSEAFPSTGYIPADFRLANGSVVRNPIIPLSLYNLLNDVDGDGLKEYSATRRLAA